MGEASAVEAVGAAGAGGVEGAAGATGTIADEIQAQLDAVEREKGVRVLFAVESGSRVWGFASPNSDYDVRFVYAHPRDWYLRLHEGRDVIEWRCDETLDVNGWDLRKFLRLAQNSNPTALEWLASPVVYRSTPWLGRLSEECACYFAPRHELNHYRHMARNNYRGFLEGEEVRLKKYLYVVRALLSARWIGERRTRPPVAFDELVAAELRMPGEAEVVLAVAEVLRAKVSSDEVGTGPRVDVLNGWIVDTFAELEAVAEAMPRDPVVPGDALDALFLEILAEGPTGPGTGPGCRGRSGGA